MNHCHNCNTETTNPKFCSRSCAAIHNNTVAQKRPLQKRSCKKCGAEIERTGYKDRRRVCNDCKPDWEKETLLSSRDKGSHRQYQRIRTAARWQYHKQNPDAACEKCGYDYHVQVCHIKAIKDFPPTATVAEVNDPSNLLGLCPNCHWEMDHPRK